MGRRLKTLRLSICRPSSTCEETREFSQTCSEAELPTGDLRHDKESLFKEFSRNPSSSGAGTTMEGQGELREHEAAKDPLCVGGGIVSRKKVGKVGTIESGNPKLPPGPLRFMDKDDN